MSFLAAWTAELHAKGYVSGVYSSGSSGISDLVARYHSGYLEPDDLWIADWNGEQSTSDPYVPASYWSGHQRLHQYSGDHTETYGGATLDIDGDYVDGATAGTSSGAGPPSTPTPPKPPTVTISSGADGTTSIGASWTGAGLKAWRVLAGVTKNALSSAGGGTAHGTRATFKLPNGSPYFAVQALGPSSQVLATSAPATAPAHLAAFGHSAFVSQNGTGGIPAGCYAGRTCHVATTMTSGGVVIATTGTESIPSGWTGILYFTLTQTGRFMLANAAGGKLPGTGRAARDGRQPGDRSAVADPLSTNGPTPSRTITQAPPVRILGTTDFVPSHGMAGILAACASPTPCHIAATIKVGGVTIAKTGTEMIGGEEAGYVFFTITGRGRQLLAGDAREPPPGRPVAGGGNQRRARNDRARRLRLARRREGEDQLGGLGRHVELRAVADAVEHHPVGVRERLVPVALRRDGPRQDPVLRAPDDPDRALDPLGVEPVALDGEVLEQRQRGRAAGRALIWCASRSGGMCSNSNGQELRRAPPTLRARRRSARRTAPRRGPAPAWSGGARSRPRRLGSPGSQPPAGASATTVRARPRAASASAT